MPTLGGERGAGTPQQMLIEMTWQIYDRGEKSLMPGTIPRRAGFEISPSADLTELKRDGDARGEQLMKVFTMKATLATDAFSVLLKMTKAIELNI